MTRFGLHLLRARATPSGHYIDGRDRRILKRARYFENLITSATAETLDQPWFTAALQYALFGQETYKCRPHALRLYNALHFLRLSMPAPGDIVQVGVSWGVVARLAAATYPNGFGRNFWLVDPWESDRPDYCSDFEAFKTLLGETASRFSIIRGYAPQACDGVTSDKINFIHFATGLTDIETVTLERLSEKLTPGGAVFVEGFAWKAGQEAAWLRAANSHGLLPLNLMNGQGVLTKPL